METITLTNNQTNESFEFELIDCNRGPQAVDFSKLFERTNIFSYDPGYGSTAGCKSTISYIDGKNSQLLYKGIPIEDIVEKYRFTDVCKLLLTDSLPKDKTESDEFDLELRHRGFLHEGLVNIFQAFPDNARQGGETGRGRIYQDRERVGVPESQATGCVGRKGFGEWYYWPS